MTYCSNRIYEAMTGHRLWVSPRGDDEWEARRRLALVALTKSPPQSTGGMIKNGKVVFTYGQPNRAQRRATKRRSTK